MAANRYSGDLRIRVAYIDAKPGDVYSDGTLRDRNGKYRCHIRPIGNRFVHTTVYVGAPAVLSHAVDSPEAFDSAAHAALSFALNDGWPVEAHAAWVDNAGWHIGRSPSKAWPTALRMHGAPGDLPPVLDPSNVSK